MSESAPTVQPVIKDVQTLKANLKEQDKRARSENEVEEVLPITDQKSPAQNGGEKRKRRKVSNPLGPTNGSQTLVLDGPLPPVEPANTLPSANGANGAPVAEEDASSAAPVSNSPGKATESSTKASHPDASAASSVNNGQAVSAVTPASSEVTNEQVNSNDAESKVGHEIPQKKPFCCSRTVDEVAHPEATKEGAKASTGAKDSAPEIINMPPEAVEVAAS